MFWSLTKLIVFVVVIAVISAGTAVLLESEGIVRIAIADREFSMSTVTFVIGGILLVPTFWIFFFLFGLARALFRFLIGDDAALKRYLNRGRERRGLDAFAEGMIALASGNPKLALGKVAKAERALGRPELTSILKAQAAELSGNSKQALLAYRELLSNQNTRFAGIAGILRQKLDEGDLDTALKLAEKAFALNPKHADIQNTLLRLQSSKRDWTGARQTLAAKFKSHSLPRDVYSRRESVLSFAEAQEKIEAGETKEGEAAVLSVNRAVPGLVPAAVLSANILTRSRETRSAAKVIRKAWGIRPHPDLAAAYAAIFPDETTEARKKRFTQLVGKFAEDPESRMLLAELAITDGNFLEARNAMNGLAHENPTVRACAIMAAIERGDGAKEEVVRSWLTKAVSAPRGPQWICDSCHHAHQEWQPICVNCEALDSLDWTDVPETSNIHPSSVEMFPRVITSKSQANPGTGESIPDSSGTDPGNDSEKEE